MNGLATRACFVLLSLAAFATAGPVGRYLGFGVGRQGSSTGAGRDSIHINFPQSDSVMAHSRVDTARIVAETLYGADQAWLIRRVSMQTQTAEQTDTSYESDDTLLRTRAVFGDSLLWLNSYRVPFAIGSSWLAGIAGTYVYDFNGDTIMDTLSIWADSSRVADTEDVAVPYGSIPGCYRIERTMLQRLATRLDTIAVIESSYIRTTEWYKDSFWSAKESIYASGPIWTKVLGFWFHTADFTSVDVSVLDGYRLSLFEKGRLPIKGHALTASPNPFRSATVIHLGTGPLDHSTTSAEVFDASGRLVLSVPVRSSPLVLQSLSLSAGTYVVRYGNDVLPITKLE